jgi:hypothetical protein
LEPWQLTHKIKLCETLDDLIRLCEKARENKLFNMISSTAAISKAGHLAKKIVHGRMQSTIAQGVAKQFKQIVRLTQVGKILVGLIAIALEHTSLSSSELLGPDGGKATEHPPMGMCCGWI